MENLSQPFAVCAGDDYSNAFSRIREHLTDRRGVRLTDFVRGLAPNYRRVYLDILFGVGALAFGIAGAGMLQSWGVPLVLVVALAAIWIGYWVAYLHLFLHEGAHWGLARDRATSDRICNFCVGWLLLIDVKDYRKVHFQHHRALGTVSDSEISYFFPLNRACSRSWRRCAKRWSIATIRPAPISTTPRLTRAPIRAYLEMDGSHGRSEAPASTGIFCIIGSHMFPIRGLPTSSAFSPVRRSPP
jgi:Fatty acid desaturase